MPNDVEWLTTASLLAELAAAGYPTTERLLETWRHEGLLPRGRQDSNYRGSVMRHPPETLRQAIAIHRAMESKKRLAFVGPVLWTAGFEVDKRHWALSLERADRWMRRSAPVTRAILRRVGATNPDQTFGEAFAPLNGMPGFLGAMGRRLNPDELIRATDVVAEIAAGEFSNFDLPASDRDLVVTESLFRKAFDFHKGGEDKILGAQLTPGRALEGVFAAISASQDGAALSDFSAIELREARDDVRNAIKSAICLYDATRWIYGDTAFGLRLIARFVRAMPMNLIFSCTLGIARLRRHQAEFYSSGEIAAMADQAEMAWLVSEYFRELFNSGSDLAKIVYPERMKLAFSSQHEHQKMLKELEIYQFPEPQFNPWASWQKLTRRTTSPGLLAMSIGAPNHLSLAETIAGASGAKTR